MNIKAVSVAHADLLRRGNSIPHLQCDACGKWVRGLSERGWCGHCEWECSAIGERVRAQLAKMREVT
jgi:hypothetical protein